MNYLLDSDVIIDFLKNKDILLVSLKGNLFASVVTVGEVLYGIKKSNSQKETDTFWQFLSNFNISPIPLTVDVIDKYVDIKVFLQKKGEIISDYDIQIASTTVINKMVLVTRNIKHFSRIKGLKIYKSK